MTWHLSFLQILKEAVVLAGDAEENAKIADEETVHGSPLEKRICLSGPVDLNLAAKVGVMPKSISAGKRVVGGIMVGKGLGRGAVAQTTSKIAK